MEKAKKLGLEVVFPRPDELMLDIDEPYEANPAIPYFSILAEHIKVLSKLVTKSKSGRTHVYLQLSRELGSFERICLQACLNSDAKRELLSALRGIAGSSCPTLLYETGDGYNKVKRWRFNRKAPSKKLTYAAPSFDGDEPF